MLAGLADIAVHSMKDVPMSFPEGLGLHAILDRGAPTDAFVSNDYPNFDALPQGARVGTSSLRRALQIRAARPDLVVLSLRGNVQTRLGKLDAGEFDAIVLATSGLERLNLGMRIADQLAPEVMLPACGQGALGIECRSDDDTLRALIAPLIDQPSSLRVRAERAMNTRLEGGCQVPIGGYAVLEDNDQTLWLRALVGAPDGSQVIHAEARGPADDPEALGIQVAEELLSRGAGAILDAVYADERPAR